jgi:DNA-binding MarR family transcriptional regulator
MIELPKLSYGLTQPKKDILDAIANRDKRPIKEIATKLAKTRGMIYQHLKELKESGYVDEKFHITVAGKLALL